jgi:hypothetical protein
LRASAAVSNKITSRKLKNHGKLGLENLEMPVPRYLLHVSASMVYALGFALMYLGQTVRGFFKSFSMIPTDLTT